MAHLIQKCIHSYPSNFAPPVYSNAMENIAPISSISPVEQMSMERSISEVSIRPVLICQICGDVARGMNFDVLTCMSCKAFFRRHALRAGKNLHCLLENNCVINKETRGSCGACRLKRCFSFGMNATLIRSPYQRKIKQPRQDHLPEPKPISLLNHDRSLLTFAEWDLLSNILHAYDEQNLVIQTQNRFKEQLSLPLKIRTKQINTLEIIGSFYVAIQPFIQRSPYFSNLSTDIRQIIVQNNLNGTGGFNTMLAAIEADVFNNETHLTTCNEIYGEDYVKESRRLLARIESNKALLKVMLMILAFSSNCSIVTYDPSTSFINLSESYTVHLLHIQDIIITMLWKYLVYQYGYNDAIRCLTRLVKNYLDVLTRTHENVSKQHWKMVDKIVEQTAHSLILDG